jgi:septum formation protein
MDWINQWNIILASKSPRRAELLRLAGYSFVVRVCEVDESYPDDLPVDKVAEYLAAKKAMAQAGDMEPADLLIAADSVVILEDRILGKPVDEEEAKAMLRTLSGREHRVITGVCLLTKESKRCFSSCSRVFVEPLTETEIRHYVEQYRPYDKAGSYGIQEWIGINRIRRIEGSYTNIMGLPTAELYEAILAFSEQ